MWGVETVVQFDAWLDQNPDLVARCYYHRQRFAEAMRLLVLALQRIGPVDSWGTGSDGRMLEVGEAVAAALAEFGDDPELVELAGSLASEPIQFSRDNEFLTDGQHRMCVMRRAGVHPIAVCLH